MLSHHFRVMVVVVLILPVRMMEDPSLAFQMLRYSFVSEPPIRDWFTGTYTTERVFLNDDMESFLRAISKMSSMPVIYGLA